MLTWIGSVEIPASSIITAAPENEISKMTTLETVVAEWVRPHTSCH